jgi:hypothetical protein
MFWTRYTHVGAGAGNTAGMLGACTYRPIAASVCADLVLNGYSDWFLPSLGELQLMHSRLHLQGLGGFGNDSYWSSSEHIQSFNHGQGWLYLGYTYYVDFSNGNVFYGENGYIGRQVRAVRAF